MKGGEDGYAGAGVRGDYHTVWHCKEHGKHKMRMWRDSYTLDWYDYQSGLTHDVEINI